MTVGLLSVEGGALSSPIERIENRSYKTYKARLKSAQRLQRLGHAWNAALISTSVATLVASVALLMDSSVYGRRGDVLLVGVSVLGLAASFVVAARNYGARAREMTASYRKIQRISVEAELLKTSSISPIDITDISRRYQDLLDESENHTEADFMAVHDGKWTVANIVSGTVSVGYTVLPWMFLIVPLLIVGRFVQWCLS
jgi:ABC-type multidrug transport system fused ATPase/permease subunit